MAEITSYEHGVPAWVDLGSSNIEESVRFYSGLFGWAHEDMGAEAGHYTMFRLRGKNVAAVGPLMAEGQPEVWSTYISVTNADEIAAKITEAGGSILAPPMDVMEAGRMGVFMDPTGAAFSIWQPNQMIGADLVNEPGTVTWNELNTRDVAAAKAFYPKVFGWGTHDNEMPGMTYTEWQVAGRTVGGMLPMPDMVPAQTPNHWLVYFAVDGTDAAVDKVKALGGSLLAGPIDAPPGPFAVVADPHGAPFAVITLPAQ